MEQMSWQLLALAGDHERYCRSMYYRNDFCSKNILRACVTKQSYHPGGQQWSAAGSVSQGMVPAGARAAKREVRVCARGRASSHATRRSILMAAAIATCWK